MPEITTSHKGYAVLKSFEGRSLKAYKCPADVWTIGYGNTNHDLALIREVLGRPDFVIKAGVTITEAEADKLLVASVTRRYEPTVRKAMPGAKVPEFDAGASFHYNTGAIGRAGWVGAWRSKDLAAVQPQLKAWNKGGGRVLAGLVRRRAREWDMISKGDYGPEGRNPPRDLTTGAIVQPTVGTGEDATTLPPWAARMESIVGLYEYPGGEDNPAIIAMARQCNDYIRRSYVHDSIAWCALTTEWCLVTTGYKGSGTLWALDSRKVGTRLSGPAVGAIATMTRSGGGHVAFVRGRTREGLLVITGGNQSDMVCDMVVNPSACHYNWPAGYAMPKVGFHELPIVAARPKVRRKFTTLPAAQQHPAAQNANPPATVGAGTGMLRMGDNGIEVKQLQEDLVRHGYPMQPYGADGEFGESTRLAVLDFQKRHPQLEDTGIADPATRAALKRTSAAKDNITNTGTTATVGEAGAAGTDAAAQSQGWFDVPVEVYWGIGVLAAVVIGWYAWKYRDEIKAMFRARFADKTEDDNGPEPGRTRRRGPVADVSGDASEEFPEVYVAGAVPHRARRKKPNRGGRTRAARPVGRTKRRRVRPA